jgi:uncharacterized membrane protein YhaH (DUF805 family)
MDFYLKRQNILWLLFSFEGRANRTQFWVGHLFYLLLAVIAVGVIFGALELFERLGLSTGSDIGFIIVGASVWLFLLVVVLSIWIKRLHDLGGPGGALVPIYLVPTILGSLSEKTYAGTNLELPLALASLIVSIVILWFFGFRSGEPEPNEYGAGPGPELAISDMK